jgi:hypothetical protein
MTVLCAYDLKPSTVIHGVILILLCERIDAGAPSPARQHHWQQQTNDNDNSTADNVGSGRVGGDDSQTSNLSIELK